MHLDRLISVLESVAVAGRPVAAAEVQQVTGLPRPTCYRLLQTLAEHRLLDQDDGGYRIGERLTRIALLGQSDVDVRALAQPTMAEAATELGEAVFLSRYRGKGVEIIHVETPSDPARSYVHPGLGFRPMHACSCSKAIAAFADDAFRDDILAGPMRAYTEHTLQDAAALRAEFLSILTTGYASCVEEIEIGVASVAAAIHVGDIGAPFSIGATGPVRRLTAKKRADIGRTLTGCADKIAAGLRLHVRATGGGATGKDVAIETGEAGFW